MTEGLTRAYNSGVSPKMCVIVDDGRAADHVVTSYVVNQPKDLQAQDYLARGLSPADVNVFNSYACSACQACLPTRINLNSFALKDAQQKLYADNADLVMDYHFGMGLLGKNKNQNAYMTLIRNYAVAKGHAVPLNIYLNYTMLDQFRGMDPWHANAHDQAGRLMALLIYFRTGRVASFFKHYYEPERDTYAGRFTIVKTMDMLKKSGDVDYVYLGPWNPLSSRTNWKLHIPGLEFLIDGQWRALTSSQKWHLREDLSQKFRNVPW